MPDFYQYPNLSSPHPNISATDIAGASIGNAILGGLGFAPIGATIGGYTNPRGVLSGIGLGGVRGLGAGIGAGGLGALGVGIGAKLNSPALAALLGLGGIIGGGGLGYHLARKATGGDEEIELAYNKLMKKREKEKMKKESALKLLKLCKKLL